MHSSKQKGNLATAAGDQAPANTSETHVGIVPNSTISQDKSRVNTSISKTDEKCGFFKWIPLLLLPVDIAGAIALGGASIGSAVQGVLVTGAAVYGNQVVKQIGKRK